MATTTYMSNFDSYIISYVSGHAHNSVITCFNGMAYVGRLIFYPDDVTLPENMMHNNAPSLHFHTTHFNNLITMMRYEKPLAVFMDTATKRGGVTTSEREPVGEQEGVGS